jgi:hypothetical protein
MPNDPRILCESPTQIVIVIFALVATIGWHVWIFLVIMRWQNHFSETQFGDSGTPQDLYSPFFLISFIQGRVLLGFASGILPWPRVVIILSGLVSLFLFIQVLVFRPCRFIMVNVSFAIACIVCIMVSAVALALTYND